jgi:hypothetical protein
MISRFFARWLVLWVFVLLMYQISDVTPQLRSTSQILKHQSKTLTIIPVTITASRRDYPSVVENRGKWFVVMRPPCQRGDEGGICKLTTLYTARHVISDTWYNYFIDWQTPLIELYHLSWDLWSATYSGAINQSDKLIYTSSLHHNQVLMWQYRTNHWSRLTWLIVSSDHEWIMIDLPVLPGDSGSPVIFSDQTVWVVSQSHSGNQAIVQKIEGLKN